MNVAQFRTFAATTPPTLLAHDVDFVLVGALSAVLQGAPVMTVDVDIVHGRSDAKHEPNDD